MARKQVSPPVRPASGLNLQTLVGRLELCRLLGCSQMTLYRAVRASQISPTWVRGKQVFTPAEVERFIAAGTPEA